MPLYIGIPVTIQEAYRLFDINIDKTTNTICSEKNVRYHFARYYLSDYLNKFFESKRLDLRIFATDKGQYIVGYKIEEPFDVWNKFITATDLVIVILNLKKKFTFEIQDYKNNFTKLTIEKMEGEPEIIEFQEPFIITWY
jgi:hypothetical protein